MRWYQIILEGGPVDIVVDGVSRPMGFYATRFVCALTEQDAAKHAIESVLGEVGARFLARTSPALPRVVVDELCEVAEGEVPSMPPGLTWFDAEADS